MKHKQQHDTNWRSRTAVVIGNRSSQPSPQWRAWRWFWMQVGCLLTYLPGGVFVWFGQKAITGQYVNAYGARVKDLFGSDASAYGWSVVGIGLWGMFAGGYHFRSRPALRWIGYFVAVAVGVGGGIMAYKSG